jgi:hypothetical protein
MLYDSLASMLKHIEMMARVMCIVRSQADLVLMRAVHEVSGVCLFPNRLLLDATVWTTWRAASGTVNNRYFHPRCWARAAHPYEDSSFFLRCLVSCLKLVCWRYSQSFALTYQNAKRDPCLFVVI